MNRLFQHPRANAALIIAPAASSEAIRFPRKLDEHVLRLTNRACVDDLLDAAPLTGKAQLMPHSEMHTVLACSGYDGFAIVERDRHRFLQQNMFALCHRGERDLAMRVTRRGDVDDVEIGLRDHLQAVGEVLCFRIKHSRLVPRGLRRRCDSD